MKDKTLRCLLILTLVSTIFVKPAMAFSGDKKNGVSKITQTTKKAAVTQAKPPMVKAVYSPKIAVPNKVSVNIPKKPVIKK